jgi:rare lipoprotein A
MLMIRFRLLPALPLLVLALACGGRRAPETKPSAPPEGTLFERGVASWYGSKFHGRRTASGERYDMHELTAAHPSLPFGTMVEVVDTASGRSVVVRINDRGPFVKGRVIDLSHAAAKRLGMIEAGLARVEVYLLE